MFHLIQVLKLIFLSLVPFYALQRTLPPYAFWSLVSQDQSNFPWSNWSPTIFLTWLVVLTSWQPGVLPLSVWYQFHVLHLWWRYSSNADGGCWSQFCDGKNLIQYFLLHFPCFQAVPNCPPGPQRPPKLHTECNYQKVDLTERLTNFQLCSLYPSLFCCCISKYIAIVHEKKKRCLTNFWHPVIIVIASSSPLLLYILLWSNLAFALTRQYCSVQYDVMGTWVLNSSKVGQQGKVQRSVTFFPFPFEKKLRK